MISSIIYRPAAEFELKHAYRWYEECEQGLGSEFIRCIEGRIELIRRHPDIFPLVHKNVRKAVIRRFPYSIFYIRVGESIIVVSIFHTSRQPIKWKRL